MEIIKIGRVERTPNMYCVLDVNVLGYLLASHILVNCWIYKFKLKCVVCSALYGEHGHGRTMCFKRRDCYVGLRMLQNSVYWIVTKDNWLPFWVIFMLLSNRVWIIFLDRKSKIHPRYLINVPFFCSFSFSSCSIERRDLMFHFHKFEICYGLFSLCIDEWPMNYQLYASQRYKMQILCILVFVSLVFIYEHMMHLQCDICMYNVAALHTFYWWEN